MSVIDTARWALFGSGDPLDFWQVILKFASPASISSIFDMEEIQTDVGRVSVWVNRVSFDLHMHVQIMVHQSLLMQTIELMNLCSP